MPRVVSSNDLLEPARIPAGGPCAVMQKNLDEICKLVLRTVGRHGPSGECKGESQMDLREFHTKFGDANLHWEDGKKAA